MRRCRKTDGFTLIEMLLVIVIIGVLAGAVVVSLSGRSKEAKVTRALADITGQFSLALDLFETDIGRYPTADEGLNALVENPDIPEWRGPYLKGGMKLDPWGSDYSYARDSTYPDRYVLTSAGPDQQLGTDDDVSG